MSRGNAKETRVIRYFVRELGDYGRTGGIMDRLANNFRRADFADIPLRGEDFRNANLRRGDLRRADLAGADLTGADLRGVLVDESTILPVGYVVEDGRVVRV